MERIRAYAEEYEISEILFGGDLFHKRGVLYTQAYNLVAAELASWKRSGLNLHANVGNHDAADRDAKIHSLSALASAGLLETVGEDGWANWMLDRGLVDVTAIAYSSDAAELRRRTDAALEDRQKLGSADFNVGLFHAGFKGARVGTSLEYVVKEDADANEYAKHFTANFSGHYHAHQEIGSQGNAWYIGSPMEFVRGETSPKGFLVLDTDAAEIERIDLDLPRFVKLTEAEITDEDFDVEAHVNGNFVDVVFEELPMPWEKVDATMRKLGALGVRAVPTKAESLSKSSRLRVDPSAGDKELLEAYMAHVNVDPSERDEILRVGMSLINGATR